MHTIFMCWTYLITVFLFTVSIMLAGVAPAHAAKPHCPSMAAMQQHPEGSQAHECDGCVEAQQEKQEKRHASGCCGDAACGMRCAAGGMNITMPIFSKAYLPRMAQNLYGVEAAEAARSLLHRNTQERPPKSLS